MQTLAKGKDQFGFGFGGTGKKSTSSQFDDYGQVGSHSLHSSVVSFVPMYRLLA